MNRVADYLSRYYESDGPDDHHPDHNFGSADMKLNPDGELIKCFIAPTNLVALMPCVDCVTGAYQTSAVYVNLGIATAQ